MFGQSCVVAITERAPAVRRASAMKVSPPTEINGSTQVMKITETGWLPDSLCRSWLQTFAQTGSKRRSLLICAQQATELLVRGQHLLDCARVGGVHGDSQPLEGLHRRQAVNGAGREHQVGMEGHNCFEARVQRTANVNFFQCLGRIIAIVGVADESVAQAEGEHDLRQIGSERHNAPNRLRHLNRSAFLIGHREG